MPLEQIKTPPQSSISLGLSWERLHTRSSRVNNPLFVRISLANVIYRGCAYQLFASSRILQGIGQGFRLNESLVNVMISPILCVCLLLYVNVEFKC